MGKRGKVRAQISKVLDMPEIGTVKVSHSTCSVVLEMSGFTDSQLSGIKNVLASEYGPLMVEDRGETQIKVTWFGNGMTPAKLEDHVLGTLVKKAGSIGPA